MHSRIKLDVMIEKCIALCECVFFVVVLGITALGLDFFVPEAAHRLPTVTTIKVPEGIDWKAVTVTAMKK